jgi:TetR/AcrR family transcriptional regulator, tetracycline repressor protein
MATATGKLSRERILAAAGRLIDQDGLEGLSMRRLAQELDVWPMSVYRYFQDKDALLDALADDAVAAVATPRPAGPWRKRLRSLLEDLRSAISEQPAGMRQRIGESMLAPGREEVSGEVLALLDEAALTPRERERAWRALLGYTFGAAALDGDDDGAFAYGLERLLDGIAPAA